MNIGILILTCGVNANILSFKEYNLLVLRIPTSLDLRPDNPNFLFRPKNKHFKLIKAIIIIIDMFHIYLNMCTND